MIRRSKGGNKTKTLKHDAPFGIDLKTTDLPTVSIHPKYGLNLTQPICFYCGQSKDQLECLGASCEGKAPKYMTYDIYPCKDCEIKQRDHAVTLEFDEDDDGNMRPTGRWSAVRNEDGDEAKPTCFDRIGHVLHWRDLNFRPLPR